MDFTRPQQHQAGATGADVPAAARGLAGTAAGPVRWRRVVSLGDSFTEGLWDVPDGAAAGTDAVVVCRGWADLLAAHLAERTPPEGDGPLRYANLAVRGRLLGDVLREQLPAALELRPDLVSLVAGGNDLLRPSGDPDALAARLDRAVARLRAAGADVLLATGMDTRHSPVIRRTRGRTGVFNAHIWSIARRRGAYVVDVWGMRSLHDWRMWADDRIHLTTEGHRRVAQAALVALGLPPDDAAWDDPLVPLPPLPRAARARADARWLRAYASPWVARRLRGQSSGDGRPPKRPDLLPVE